MEGISKVAVSNNNEKAQQDRQPEGIVSEGNNLLDDLHKIDQMLLEHDANQFAIEYPIVVRDFVECGFDPVGNFTQVMRDYASQYPNLIVRREDPQRLLSIIASKGALEIRFDTDAHGGRAYPNAGVLGGDAGGLRVPYQRGFGRLRSEENGAGCVVTVVGFEQSDSVTARSLPADEYLHYNNPTERPYVRMVEGTVSFESIKFVILLIPRSYFPEEMMTDSELNQDTPYISRLFTHTGAVAKELENAA